MRWKDLNSAWKGSIVGGMTFVVSSFGVVFYILYFMGGVVLMAASNSLMILASLKLAWGVTSGYFIGSLFGKKKLH